MKNKMLIRSGLAALALMTVASASHAHDPDE